MEKLEVTYFRLKVNPQETANLQIVEVRRFLFYFHKFVTQALKKYMNSQEKLNKKG